MSDEIPKDNDDDGTDEDYEVGYGRPPKEHRWVKGQSGNARGSKKGSRGPQDRSQQGAEHQGDDQDQRQNLQGCDAGAGNARPRHAGCFW